MSERTFPPSVQPGIPRISPPQKNWSRQSIGDLFEVVSRPAGIKDDQKYRLITVRRSRGGLDQRSELFGHEISVKSQFFVETGDFLISKRQIVHGACGMVPAELDGAIVSNEYAVFRCTTLLDSAYLNQLVHSIYLQQTYFHSSVGVHIEKMIFKPSEWFKWPINLPTLPEQRKIANFLGAVDTKIAQLAEKKRLLEDYKKGCMQQLFSQKIRFKDDTGNDFPDWEEKRLGELADIRTGKKDVNEGNPEGAFPFFTCAKQHTYSDSFSFDTDAILIAGNGEVGHCQRYSGKFEAYQRTYVLSGFKTSFDYLYVYMSTKFVEHVQSQKQMGAMPYIKLGVLKNFPIPYPHPDEQRKIADFLSALDRKIDLVGQELTHARTFKQGLLQQMFV